MKKLLVLVLLLALSAQANLTEIWIAGTISEFNSVTVTVKDETGNKTIIPRNLTVKNIRTGEKIRVVVTEKQFEEIKKLNQKR